MFSPAPQKKKRDDQNTVRTLLRRILKIISRAYKIHQVGDGFNDKRQLIALFRIIPEGEAIALRRNLAAEFSVLDMSLSKDRKIKAHLDFLFELSEMDLEERNIEETLRRFATVGQEKSHPVNYSKFQLEAYLRVEAQVRARLNE